MKAATIQQRRDDCPKCTESWVACWLAPSRVISWRRLPAYARIEGREAPNQTAIFSAGTCPAPPSRIQRPCFEFTPPSVPERILSRCVGGHSDDAAPYGQHLTPNTATSEHRLRVHRFLPCLRLLQAPTARRSPCSHCPPALNQVAIVVVEVQGRQKSVVCHGAVSSKATPMTPGGPPPVAVLEKFRVWS